MTIAFCMWPLQWQLGNQTTATSIPFFGGKGILFIYYSGISPFK
uniref:Uncharacterized protein n=1 Tax=Anguilla anguilla TaxID=7936 RepID=A0A0E9Q0H0_ANGAN